MRRGKAKGAPLSPARNVHIDKGQPVTVDDIRKYALPKHVPCRGTGIVSTKATAHVCACATRRFLKKHSEVIMDDSGTAWWPARDPVLE